MSMQCSSIFPRCTAPQSRDEPIPVGGRVPLCLHLCIIPLVMCPGFWIGDIIGTCTMVSVPPMCTQAFFWNLVMHLAVFAGALTLITWSSDCRRNTSASTKATRTQGIAPKRMLAALTEMRTPRCTSLLQRYPAQLLQKLGRSLNYRQCREAYL